MGKAQGTRYKVQAKVQGSRLKAQERPKTQDIRYKIQYPIIRKWLKVKDENSLELKNVGYDLELGTCQFLAP
jgi:hypothetical protein